VGPDQIRHTLLAEAAVGATGLQELAVSPPNAADDAPPTATVAHPVPRSVPPDVSHSSLSPEDRTAGKIASECYFGGPANSGSPVALRPSLTRGLPLSAFLKH
jgi:hypothetical protein